MFIFSCIEMPTHQEPTSGTKKTPHLEGKLLFQTITFGGRGLTSDTPKGKTQDGWEASQIVNKPSCIREEKPTSLENDLFLLLSWLHVPLSQRLTWGEHRPEAGKPI